LEDVLLTKDWQIPQLNNLSQPTVYGFSPMIIPHCFFSMQTYQDKEEVLSHVYNYLIFEMLENIPRDKRGEERGVLKTGTICRCLLLGWVLSELKF